MKEESSYFKDIQAAVESMDIWEGLKNKTVLITGSTGMVGVTLVDILLSLNSARDLNIKIVAMGRCREKGRERLGRAWNHKNFIFIEHSLQNPIFPGVLDSYKVDFLIHGASTTHPLAYVTEPVETITINIVGAQYLLEFIKNSGSGRFVFLSSVEIYGENRGDVERFSEDYCGYINCNTLRAGYPESKRVSEALCQAYHQMYGVDVVIPRLSRIYGPTMQSSDSKAIAQFFKKACLKEDIILKSEGSQLYSYTYVVDAAMAILLVTLKGKTGEAYNVSTDDNEMTLYMIAEFLAKQAGVSVILDIPDRMEEAGYSTATKAVLNNEKLHSLGWKPLTDMKKGLSKTLEGDFI